MCWNVWRRLLLTLTTTHLAVGSDASSAAFVLRVCCSVLGYLDTGCWLEFRFSCCCVCVHFTRATTACISLLALHHSSQIPASELWVVLSVCGWVALHISIVNFVRFCCCFLKSIDPCNFVFQLLVTLLFTN